MPEKIRLSCRIKPHGVEVETVELSKQLDILGRPLQLSIETQLDVVCKVEKIVPKGESYEVVPLGEFKEQVRVEDNEALLTIEADKDVLPAFLSKAPLLGFFK